MEYYWCIELWNGEKIDVKPENVELVQNKISSGNGFIKTPTLTINIKDVKGFNLTDKLYTTQNLIEESAQAFNEPVIRNGAIQVSWVKKSVPLRKWNTYYSPNPAYRMISETDNSVMIAFRIPTHLINKLLVTELTASEIDSNGLFSR